MPGWALGTKLRQYRQERGETLEQLAERIGLSPSFLSAIEHGQKKPSLATIRRISEALNIPMAYLVAPEGTEVGAKLRLIREGRAMTLSELSEATGIPVETLAKYERNEEVPDLSTIEILAEALDVTARYFLDRTSSNVGIGQRLARARQQAGLTLTELAQRVGVSASMLSQIENDKVVPSLETLDKAAEALGLSVCYFLMDQEDVHDLLASLSQDVRELLMDPRVQGVLRAVRDFNKGELRYILNQIEFFKRNRHLLR